MKPKLILVVEDEVSIRDMIKFALATSEFEIREANNCQEAELQIAEAMPDIILLDWMLPGMSGIDYVKKLKSSATTQLIPIIMLTARAEMDHKVTGLELGVDDYVTKPFSPRELIARIKTILRRGPLINVSGVIKIEKLQLNVDKQQVMIDDQLIPLTPIEYKLLEFFLKHQDRIYSRDQLLTHIWRGSYDIDDRTVDVQIQRLRKRLKPFGYDNWIKTIRGTGYQFSRE